MFGFRIQFLRVLQIVMVSNIWLENVRIYSQICEDENVQFVAYSYFDGMDIIVLCVSVSWAICNTSSGNL